MEVLPRSLRIGVLRGGPSPEYDLSLKSGQNVLNILSETHRPIDIFISSDGRWHMQGLERPPERILRNVDVVFNALHGTYGEDGGVQTILDTHGVRYTGSPKYASMVAMNKWLSKEHAISGGIKTPIGFLVRTSGSFKRRAREIWNSITHPLVVKPSRGGSAFGFAIVETLPDLVGALQTVMSDHGNAIVEEFIPGHSVSCLVLNKFRGQDIYAFPPTKQLKKEEALEVENLARRIHEILGLGQYSQSDFIVSPKRGIYFLEVNSLPKLTEKSLALKSMDFVGLSTKDFVHHVLLLALE